MKKLWVVLLAVFFMLFDAGISLAESSKPPEPIEFQASQSYEFIDIVENFIAYNNSNQSIVSNQNVKKACPEFLYWLDKNAIHPIGSKNMDPLYYFGGKIGVLFNDKAHEKTEQLFENGLLKNTRVPLGYTADYVYTSPLYWGFNSVQLQLNISPVQIKKNIDGDTKSFKLDLDTYFSSRNYSVTKLSDTGNLNFGKSLWRVITPKSKRIYLIASTSCGANGLIGSTHFVFYFNEKDATEFYDKLLPR